MELHDTTQLALERALAGTSARHAAIASNIANVNTPGYRRKDVDFKETLQSALAGNDRHALEAFQPTEAVDPSAPMRADGNSVDIDVEAAAQAKNGLEYEALAAVMKARTAILKAAIGVG